MLEQLGRPTRRSSGQHDLATVSVCHLSSKTPRCAPSGVPVRAGGLHRGRGDPLTGEPVGQGSPRSTMPRCMHGTPVRGAEEGLASTEWAALCIQPERAQPAPPGLSSFEGSGTRRELSGLDVHHDSTTVLLDRVHRHRIGGRQRVRPAGLDIEDRVMTRTLDLVALEPAVAEECVFV